jgi:MFS family permease/ketosteroid isomerase-like protein
MPDLSLLKPLRHRDFRLLWLGASTSLLGDGIYLIALAWQALTLHHGPGGLALLGVCATGPQLLCVVFGGVVSDRYDRRRVLLIADIVRCAAVGTVAWIAANGHLRLWHLAVLSVVYGAGAGFAAPAFDSILPSLVDDDDLEQANALDQFLRPMMLRLVGPAVGGGLVASLGAAGAFFADAATFGISAGCILLMRPRPVAEQFSESSLLQDAAEGLRFVRSRLWLWGTFASASIAYLLFIGPMEVLLPYLIRTDFHGSAQIFGVVLAAGGLGAIGAALLIAQTGLPRRQFTFMYLTWTVGTFAVAGYGLATHGWQLAVASLVINAFEAAGTIAWATTKQRLVPQGLLGRVSSLDWCISIAFLPLSYAITAPVAAVLGARPTLVAAGVLGGVITLGAMFLPQMRAPDGFPADLSPRDSPGVSAVPHHSPLSDTHQAVLDAFEQFTRAFAHRDVQALLASCSDDVTYVGSEDGEQATGQADVSALLAGVFDRPEAYVFTWLPALIGYQGRTAWLLANGSGIVQSDDPGSDPDPDPFGYRLSGVLREENGCWRWVLIHGGEPTPRLETSTSRSGSAAS